MNGSTDGTGSGPAIIRGCLVDLAGMPIHTAKITLDGRFAPERSPGTGMVPEQRLTEGPDGEGCFRLQIDPDPARRYLLVIRPESHAATSYEWETLRRNEVVDLGRIELGPGGIIVGRVLDQRGEAVLENVAVVAFPVGADELGSKALVGSRTADPGGFQIGAVSPGPWIVRARHVGLDCVAEARIELGEGENVHQDLVLPLANAQASVRVDVWVEPPRPIAGGDLELVVLTDARGVRHEQRARNPGLVGQRLFDGLPPGPCIIEITDRRFHPWSAQGVLPGGPPVQAVLRGSAALRLSVGDAGTGDPIEDYEMTLATRDMFGTTRRSLVKGRSDPHPSDGVYDGVIPGAWTLSVGAPGHGAEVVPLGELAPGEERSISILLGGPASLAGRVVHAGGEAVEQPVDVRLSRRLPDAGELIDVHRMTSDSSGAFRFDDAGQGDWRIDVKLPSGLSGSVELVLGPDEHREGVLVVLSPSADVLGTVLLPDCIPFDGARVGARPVDPSVVGSPPGGNAALTQDGRFHLSGLAPGSYNLFLEPAAPEGVRLGWLDQRGWSMGAVELATGTTQWRADMRDKLAQEFVCRLDCASGSLQGCQVALSGDSWSAGALVGSSGETRIGPLPAKPALVSLIAADKTWALVLDEALDLRPCARREIHSTVSLLAGELEVVTVDGEKPVANRELLLMTLPETPGFRRRVSTDSVGHLALELPVGGRYELRPGPQAQAIEGGRFSWEPSGAEPRRLRLALDE